MKGNFKKAYDKLKALGVPLFERNDRPGTFLISAEDEDSYKWVDYYNEYGRFPDFGCHAKIRETLEPLGLYVEWENPGCLVVYEI